MPLHRESSQSSDISLFFPPSSAVSMKVKNGVLKGKNALLCIFRIKLQVIMKKEKLKKIWKKQALPSCLKDTLVFRVTR